MTRTLIGIDYEGVPSLKITKGDLDPVTTPDGTLGAFLFNSKDQIQVRLNKIEVTSPGAENGIFPADAGPGNFQRYRYNWQGSWLVYYYQKSFFEGLDFDIPLTDFLVKDAATGFYKRGKNVPYQYIGNQNSDVGYVRLETPSARNGEAGWKINMSTGFNWSAPPNYFFPYLLHFLNVYNPAGMTDATANLHTDVVTWNLPATAQALPVPLPVQPGQRSIRIDSGGLKIAKPGYDVDIATEQQLVVSSSMRPIKIIAADDIAIPAGASEHILPVTIPANSVCDVQYYIGSELVYPALPRSETVGADWRLLSDRIQFQNAGIACRARFVVMANDLVSQTVGDNEVFRQFTVNGENVVQFLKPGASNDPSFADTVIDSRWPCLRILKEGFFDVAAGAQITNVPIDTTTYFPFVKFMVTCGPNAIANIENYQASIRPPTVGMAKLNYGGNNGWFETGDTTYARVTADNVAFHTFRGRAKYYYWTYNSGSRQWTLRTVMPDEVLGIRYYIFGIPKKDIP